MTRYSKGPHAHNFCTGYWYNCSLLLSVLVNLLLCPMYKLSFAIGIYVYRNTWSVQDLVLPAISGIYLGILQCNPLDTGVGDYYAIFYVASPVCSKIDPAHVDQRD